MLEALIADQVLTCPACRAPTPSGLRNAPLAWDSLLQRDAHGRPRQGTLSCTHCGTIYPVIDGIAAIFADLSGWVRTHERALLWRDDLAPHLSSFLHHAWAEDSDPNWRRQMLAVYGRQLGPSTADSELIDPGLQALQQRHSAGLQEAHDALLTNLLEDSLVLDAGCGVGTDALAVAARGAHVVAMDQDPGPLRLLARLLRTGRAEVPRWRHGGTDVVSVAATLEDPAVAGRMALVAGDILDPPFAAGSFAAAAAHQVIDNVAEPVTAVRQLHGLVSPGGRLLVASPFDWSPRATAPAQRLGDGIRHGQSSCPATGLHALLTGDLPHHAPELSCTVVHEAELPWVLVRHRRSAHVYVSRVVVAERSAMQPLSS